MLPKDLKTAFRTANKTYVKVRCEGDRTRPFYAKPKEGSTEAAVFEDAQYGFIVVHSNAVMLMKARDDARGQFYGQVGVQRRKLPSAGNPLAAVCSLLL